MPAITHCHFSMPGNHATLGGTELRLVHGTLLVITRGKLPSKRKTDKEGYTRLTISPANNL